MQEDDLNFCYKEKLLNVSTPLGEQKYIFQLLAVGNADQTHLGLVFSQMSSGTTKLVNTCLLLEESPNTINVLCPEYVGAIAESYNVLLQQCSLKH